jgi:hypothetical protein
MCAQFSVVSGTGPTITTLPGAPATEIVPVA